MTIIVFLIDTSASMNQRSYLGTSYLDIAKGAVDTFLKLRQKEIGRGLDRYMLLTFDEAPHNIKAGWRDGNNVFMRELKDLTAESLTTFGCALGNCLNMLSVNRLQTGLDTFGAGRSPWFLEPTVIVSITDGGSFNSVRGTSTDIEIPRTVIMGHELCSEPFRWDQRLFTLVLRFPSHFPDDAPPPGSHIPPDVSGVTAMCDVTGGRSYSLLNMRMVHQCLESLVQKIQCGVVVHFEKSPDEDEPLDNVKEIPIENGFLNHHSNLTRNSFKINGTSEHVSLSAAKQLNASRPVSPSVNLTAAAGNDWQSVRRMMFVSKPSTGRGGGAALTGSWPIPEAYWPDPQLTALPPRSAHPTLRFTLVGSEPSIVENFPFDKYELEPSPLTQKMLSLRQIDVCWQVSVLNSGRVGSRADAPFGYLKPSENLTTVNLFVLPFNYPRLLPLLKELFTILKCKASKEWKFAFEKYLRTVPPYYYAPLRRALQRMGASAQIFPDWMHDNYLNHTVASYLKRLRSDAKSEFDRMCQAVAMTVTNAGGSASTTRVDHIRLSARSRVPLSLLIGQGGVHDVSKEQIQRLKNESHEYQGFMLSSSSTLLVVPSSRWNVVGGHTRALQSSDHQKMIGSSFKNPFDVSRGVLLRQIAKMRANLMQHFDQHNNYAAGSNNASLGSVRLQQTDELHNLPVADMGNYHEYLKNMPTPLRELVAAPARLHAFGNPFKVDKGIRIDEAIDIDIPLGSEASTSDSAVGNGSSKSNRRGTKRPLASNTDSHLRRKRQPGPLPRNFVFKRQRTSGSVSSVGSDLSEDEATQRMAHTAIAEAFETDSAVDSDADYPVVIEVTSLSGECSEDADSDTASEASFVSFCESSDDSMSMSGTKSAQKPSCNGSAVYEEDLLFADYASPDVAASARVSLDSPSSDLTCEEISDAKARLRSFVRKPGLDLLVILKYLRSLRPISHQMQMAKFAQVEARRLKRHSLFDALALFCRNDTRV